MFLFPLFNSLFVYLDSFLSFLDNHRLIVPTPHINALILHCRQRKVNGKGLRNVVQWKKRLPAKCKALGSIPSTNQTRSMAPHAPRMAYAHSQAADFLGVSCSLERRVGTAWDCSSDVERARRFKTFPPNLEATWKL